MALLSKTVAPSSTMAGTLPFGLTARYAAVNCSPLRVSMGIGPTPDPQGLMPILVAAAGLCVAGLARVRAPFVAWLATILVLTVATLSIAAWGRSNRAAIGLPSWPWVVAFVSIGALAAIGSAMLYATDHRRRLGDWVSALALVGIGAVGAICVWVYATLG